MSEGKKREHVGRTVRAEIDVHASTSEVYDAWADPEGIARWFVDRAEGVARTGETVTWHFEAMGYELPIPIAEAVPGERIVMAGEAPGRPAFLQEILLEQRGGKTRLRLANSGFREGAEWDDEYEGVASGWEMALATLKHQLERYPGRSRRHLFAMRPAAFEYADLLPSYTTSDGLEDWLATSTDLSADELASGVELRLDLANGERLTGEVLARTKRELLLEWREREAVLALKAFALPTGRAVALDLSTWAEDAAPLPNEELEQALDRLTAKLRSAVRSSP